MKAILFLMFMLMSYSSMAQWRHDNYFNYPSGSVDGKVRITSAQKLLPGVKWVWVNIVGNGKTDDNIFAVEDSEAFDKTLYLRYGSGTYQFQIMTSKAANKYGQYAIEHQGTFFNSYKEELDDIAPTQNVQSEDEEIVNLSQDITQGLQTDLEKTKAIHDWVTSNIAYDVDSYFQGTYAQKEWDAVSVLREKKAICFGYANLTAALNRAAGLKAKVVIGQADVYQIGWSDHAWNKVLVDRRWISMDTTWDAGSVDFVRKTFKFMPRSKYFNQTAEEFAKDHREK